jgi:porin
MSRCALIRIAARTSLVVLAWIQFLTVASNNAFSWQAPIPASSQAPSPQQTPQPSSTPATKKMDCPHSANPHRRHTGCKDEDFDWDETLSRTMNGIRSKMRELGISPTLSYMGALQTNVTGQTHQMWGYAGQLLGGLDVDFEKLLKIKGMSVYVGGSWGTGDNLSGSLRNLFPVNSFYAPSYYLGEMYLQQSLLNKNLTLLGGRLAASNSFATLPVFSNYVNYGLNPNPYPLGGNDITFFGPPTGTEWGAQATYNVTPKVQVSAGLFNTNLNSANGQNHGTDWTLQQGNKGALVVAEVSYYPHQIATDNGKQGEYTVGVITDNNSFPTLPNGDTRTSGYTGVFAMAQEMVYQPDGPNTSRGLTVWGSWAYNSKPLISPLPLFWGAGASYRGLIPSRKNDVASAGWIYGQVSNLVPSTSAEQVLEVNYSVSYRRFLVITPDFQYIWKPGGYSVPGVAVAGVQASITF